jgi:hypothetical protein
MAMMGKIVKLDTLSGEVVISNIEEYVCGFAYFYVRHTDGSTYSFDREDILGAYRKLPTGDFRAIHLKKVKVHEAFDQE